MQAFKTVELRAKLRPLMSRVRGTEWAFATLDEGRIDAYIAGMEGLIVFREAVLGVASLLGRVGVLSVLWDELAEEAVRTINAEGDRGLETNLVNKLVTNAEGRCEGTTNGKVIVDLSDYLGIKQIVDDLTHALEMANGVGGIIQVITWDLNADEE